MREPIIDDERLAALLDGRLEAGERDALLARIADSDDEYRVFADAAALMRQQEAEPAVVEPRPGTAPDRTPSPPPSMVARRRGWRRPAAWMALAAVVAALALIPVLRSRWADPYDPARLAARLSEPPRGWTDDNPFGNTRGGGTPNVTDEARAARIGAFLVDLELAVRARDSASIAQYARRVGALVEMGSIATVYAQIDSSAGQPERLPALLKEGREDVAQVTDDAYREAGAWAEAAHVAAATQNSDFFRDSQARTALDRIAALPSLSDRGREAVAGIRRALPERGTPDWVALSEGLPSLLWALGH